MSDRDLIIRSFSRNRIDYGADQSIIDLFSEQVSCYPDSIALACGDLEMTYEELDVRSSILAVYLVNAGLVRESLVGLFIDRSMLMIVSLLGILKAGGAFVPLDPDYPPERIRFMLEDSQCRFILTGTEYRHRLDARMFQLILPDEVLSQSREIQDISDRPCVHPSQLAYVIYTSGSTGKPKGVMIEHKGVVNMVRGKAEALKLRPGIRAFQFSSISFDASIYEIFCTLLYGGYLVLAPRQVLHDPDLLTDVIQRHGIELITLPPSYQHLLKDPISCIKTVVSGGEPLIPMQARRLQERGIRVVNCYGPTENTVCATWSVQPITRENVVSIGKPIGNVDAYILDDKLEPVEIGEKGELYLGGPQVARGYWGRTELTARAFIPNPFDSGRWARLYRTGDLVRWLPDGNIEYLGRLDEQTKIRGYRIEPGEIESVLKQVPGVLQCAVVVQEDVQGDKRLAGFVVADARYRQADAVAYLKERLPEYMQLHTIKELSALPLNESGKTDRKKLKL